MFLTVKEIRVFSFGCLSSAVYRAWRSYRLKSIIQDRGMALLLVMKGLRKTATVTESNQFESISVFFPLGCFGSEEKGSF